MKTAEKGENDTTGEGARQKTITRLVAVSMLGRARVGNDSLSLTAEH